MEEELRQIREIGRTCLRDKLLCQTDKWKPNERKLRSTWALLTLRQLGYEKYKNIIKDLAKGKLSPKLVGFTESEGRAFKTARVKSGFTSLQQRQRVMELVDQGKKPNQIALLLHIGASYVRMLKARGLSERVQAQRRKERET